MAANKLKDIRSKMKKLDICMMTTISTRGSLTSRPMSNNGDVEYDGNSWFFTFETSQKIKDIENNRQVNISFSDNNGFYLSVNGSATLIRKKSMMLEHWIDELKQWFPDGIDTEGIIMIHVIAKHATYWDKNDGGEISL